MSTEHHGDDEETVVPSRTDRPPPNPLHVGGRHRGVGWSLLRGLRAFVLGLLALVVFLVAVVGAVVLHLGIPPARRLVATQLPALLEGAFPGKVVVHTLGALSIGGVGRVDVDLVHPDGQVVATLRNVSVEIATLQILRSLPGSGPMVVPIEEVKVDAVDLDASGTDGRFRIVDVFVDPDAPETPEDPKAKGLDLRLERLDVKHLWAHGTIVSTPTEPGAAATVIPVDADVDHLWGSLRLTPDATVVALENADLLTRQMVQGANLDVRLAGALTLPDAPEPGEPAQTVLAAVNGKVAGTPVSLLGVLWGDAVHAFVSLPDVRPEHLRTVAPTAPALAAPATIGGHVDGTVDHLTGHALVLAGASRLAVNAEVTLAPSLVAEAHLRGHALDASLLGGPRSALSLHADAEVRLPEGQEPSGEVRIETEKGTIAPADGQTLVVPAILARATFEGERAKGTADIQEPGVLTHVSFDVAPGPRGPIADVELAAPQVELAQLHARGVDARGKLKVDAKAHLDLGAEQVVASATVSGADLASPLVPGVAIGTVEVDARASGALAAPAIDASVLARNVTAQGQRIQQASVKADGPMFHPVVSAEVVAADLPRLRARTTVHLEPALALEGAWVEASRGGVVARAEVDRVDVGAGMPTVREVRVDGLGERATFSMTPTAKGGTRFAADAPRLSIPAIARLAGVATAVTRGDVGLDADVAMSSGRIDGDVVLELDDLDAVAPGGAVQDLDARVDATFEGRRVLLDVVAESGPLGRLEVTSRRPIDLAGPPEDPRSWIGATGQIAVDGDLDLATLSRLLPAGTLPVTDVSGRLVVVAQVDRDLRGKAPSARIAMRTEKLAVVGPPRPQAPVDGPGSTRDVKPDPNPPTATLTAAEKRNEDKTDRALSPVKPEVVEPERDPARTGAQRVGRRAADPAPIPAWTLRGVDLTFNARAEPEPKQRIAVAASVTDVRGALVTLDLDADLAYARLLATGVGDRRWIEDTPLTLHVAVPNRAIEELPPSLGIPEIPGRMMADLRATGTLRNPKVDLDAALVGLSIEETRLEKPFATKIVARYDGRKAEAHLAIDQATTRLLKGKVDAEVAMADVLRPPAKGEMPWTASADVELGPLPLDILRAVTPAPIEGVARGRLKLDQLHRDAKLDVELDVEGLVVGGIPHREARVRLKAAGERLDGSLRLVQPKGSITADAKVGIAWGGRMAPELRADRAFDVGVRADNFRVKAVEPFLTSTLNQLDGRLDGAVRVSDAAALKALGSGGVQAKLAFSQGTVEVAGAGGRMQDVRATVRLDDRGVLRLDDVFARGTTGEVRAAGLATFGERGLEAAKLNVAIPDRKPMPILVEGEHMGDVAGTIQAEAGWTDGREELRVTVEIPKLEVALPTRAPDGVQKLDEIAHARIGTVRNGRFFALPLDAPDPVEEQTPSAFRTRLDVILREANITQGDILRTQIAGNPSVILEDGKTRMDGAITVKGGRVDIKGRRFEIEHGTVTFGEDPANPDVILTASWEAPDGTMVYADFAGPLETGKVTLRSNPPRSREEILALVVFGRVEGMQPGGDQADTTTQAIGTAGGFATQGLNAALADITSLDIRTRVDTSSSTNPRPELEVQISQEVAVRIAHLLGEIGPGQAADKTFATVDWAFRPEWSLETTVGDKASTTVDMIWEHLY